MEYANQIQELTERSVSDCASGCTQLQRGQTGHFNLAICFALIYLSHTSLERDRYIKAIFRLSLRSDHLFRSHTLFVLFDWYS